MKTVFVGKSSARYFANCGPQFDSAAPTNPFSVVMRKMIFVKKFRKTQLII